MKLVVLYTQPDDPEAFDNWYFNQHAPLVAAVDGISKTVVTKFNRTLQGNGYYLMAELHFPDKETMKSAMRSPAMGAVGKDAQDNAGDLISMMLGADVE